VRAQPHSRAWHRFETYRRTRYLHSRRRDAAASPATRVGAVPPSFDRQERALRTQDFPAPSPRQRGLSVCNHTDMHAQVQAQSRSRACHCQSVGVRRRRWQQAHHRTRHLYVCHTAAVASPTICDAVALLAPSRRDVRGRWPYWTVTTTPPRDRRRHRAAAAAPPLTRGACAQPPPPRPGFQTHLQDSAGQSPRQGGLCARHTDAAASPTTRGDAASTRQSCRATVPARVRVQARSAPPPRHDAQRRRRAGAPATPVSHDAPVRTPRGDPAHAATEGLAWVLLQLLHDSMGRTAA
jgi:hypothetical protein